MGVLLCYLVTCILFTVRGSSPNRRAAARSLRPSIRTAWRTRPYSSTPFIPALCQSNAKGYLLPDFYSGCATGIPGRFSEGLLLRRVHRSKPFDFWRMAYTSVVMYAGAERARVPKAKIAGLSVILFPPVRVSRVKCAQGPVGY